MGLDHARWSSNVSNNVAMARAIEMGRARCSVCFPPISRQ